MRRLLLVGLVLGGVGSAGHAQPIPPDTAILRFFAVWDSTWRLSERDRIPEDPHHGRGLIPPPGGLIRRAASHCSTVYPQTPEQLPYIRGDFVRSRLARFAVCPGWFLGGVAYEGGYSEADWLDAAITPARRPGVLAARDTLLATLEDAARAAPTDSFVIGQLVRFAVDQQAWPRAYAAAERCAASLAWCAALRGYVYARHRRGPEAAAAFDTAWHAASPAQRCLWGNHRMLLELDQRAAYERRSCDERAAVDAWLWPLAELLWIDPLNHRRVEHWRRLIEVALRQALPRDERWTWLDSLGGDARAEMVLRYGWPSFVYWPGTIVDSSSFEPHSRQKFPPPPPYTTYEYAAGRVRVVPPLEVLADPFGLRATAWAMNPPPGGDGFRDAPLWWPIEHFAPPYPLAQLPEGQTAFLRRQTHIHLATATPLDVAHTKRRPQETLDPIHLLIAHTPDSIRPLATTRGLIGSPAVLTADIEPRPAVLSIEYTGVGPGRLAGRARYGIRPPEALAALAPGERAISDPVILRVPSLNSALPSHPDSALRWMAGTTTIPPVGTLGVYWETYGFAPDDSVEHAVWIQRVTPQGTLRRLGISLQVATDRNTPVATSWTETRLGPTATDLGGPVRIIGRSLLLNVAALPRGEYVLEVAATVGGHPPVRGQRSFTIQ